MTANSRFSSAIARCLLFSVTMAVLGLTWGCGGAIPSHATLDEGAQARVQAAQDAMKKEHEKKRKARPFAGPKQEKAATAETAEPGP